MRKEDWTVLGLMLDWYRARRAEVRLRGQAAELQESLYGSYGTLANRYVDTDALRYGIGQGYDQQGRRQVSLDKARRESREFVQTNAHARNIMSQIVNFTVGSGFAIKFVEEADRAQWTGDSRQLKWPKRRREIVRRLVRDGEAYLRRFGNGDDGDLRFVEPNRIKSPAGRVDSDEEGLRQGVIFDKDDVELITGYWIDGEEVPADRVFRFLDPFSDLCEVRGWPLVYDAIPIIDQYERWVKTRAVLNELRSAIFMMRKHLGHSPAQVQTFVDSVKAGTIARPSGKTQAWADHPLAGTVIDHTEDIEYTFPGAKIQAGDAADDGRMMRLLIACFFSLPEYLVTADAQNANYASTLVAETPGIMAMRSWQGSFGDDVDQFIDWWYGRPVETKLVFPNLVSRDPLKDAQARAIRADNGALSIETWMELDGLDPVTEREKMAQTGETE